MLTEDVLFESALDTHAIRYRLHPLDVGFDLRVQRMLVQIDPADTNLRVSYPGKDGERRVMAGPRADVLKRLRSLGFLVAALAAFAAAACSAAPEPPDVGTDAAADDSADSAPDAGFTGCPRLVADPDPACEVVRDPTAFDGICECPNCDGPLRCRDPVSCEPGHKPNPAAVCVLAGTDSETGNSVYCCFPS
jgi:hypothetical protein